MIFFTGMDHPSDAGKVPAAFVSVHSLRGRKSGFPVRRWIMDSGAFRTIELHGGYPFPPSEYACYIRQFAGNGKLLAAVSQDYMCETFMLAKTGLTVADHQRLTIERYDQLLEDDLNGVYLMPVLQGFSPESYVQHIEQYGDRLRPRAWVGVGSVCRRNRHPSEVLNVLDAIKHARPDLRLHAFGIKTTALYHVGVRRLLFSADSMAWSFSARYNGRDNHDPAEALAFHRKVSGIINDGRDEYQTSLFQA